MYIKYPGTTSDFADTGRMMLAKRSAIRECRVDLLIKVLREAKLQFVNSNSRFICYAVNDAIYECKDGHSLIKFIKRLPPARYDGSVLEKCDGYTWVDLAINDLVHGAFKRRWWINLHTLYDEEGNKVARVAHEVRIKAIDELINYLKGN
jgi:hypothetical protein